jgi:hypothetical protein
MQPMLMILKSQSNVQDVWENVEAYQLFHVISLQYALNISNQLFWPVTNLSVFIYLQFCEQFYI